MNKIGINFDEISDNIDESIQTITNLELKYAELRTINKKNFVFWDIDELDNFKRKIKKSNIEVIAAATPLFKWYTNKNDSEIPHDNFGFNPRLTRMEKVDIIRSTIDKAKYLNIAMLRIFSGLGNIKDPGAVFSKDDLLLEAIQIAQDNDMTLLLENEPVCTIKKKQDIIDFINDSKDSSLQIWLDIANLLSIGEEIDDNFIYTISPRLKYLHVKDFIQKENTITYVPVSTGEINYGKILKDIFRRAQNDLYITIETHATKDKIKASIESVNGLKKILDSIGVQYA